MYRLASTEKNLCRYFAKTLQLRLASCDYYSIWHFSAGAHWKSIVGFFTSCALCQSDWFPFIYWTVLIIASLGSIFSFIELLQIYVCDCEATTWRARYYYVIPEPMVRKCRLMGAAYMMNCWLLLVYAAINVSPAHMAPWIFTNTLTLGFELLTWLFQVLFGRTRLTMTTTLTFVLPLINYFCVKCVCNVFYKAFKAKETEELELWKNMCLPMISC